MTTYTSLNINLKTYKRFYPGGNKNPIGHLKKLMSLTNNNTSKTSLPDVETQPLHNNPLMSQKNKQIVTEQIQQSNPNTTIQNPDEIFSQDKFKLLENTHDLF